MIGVSGADPARHQPTPSFPTSRSGPPRARCRSRSCPAAPGHDPHHPSGLWAEFEPTGSGGRQRSGSRRTAGCSSRKRATTGPRWVRRSWRRRRRRGLRGRGCRRDVAGGHAVLPGAGHLDRSIVSLWMWIPMLEPVGTTDTVGATVSGPSDPHTSTLVRYGNEWVFLFAHATGS